MGLIRRNRIMVCPPLKTIGQNNDVVTFNIDENNLPDDRNATYTFTLCNGVRQIVLTQKAKMH